MIIFREPDESLVIFTKTGKEIPLEWKEGIPPKRGKGGITNEDQGIFKYWECACTGKGNQQVVERKPQDKDNANKAELRLR